MTLTKGSVVYIWQESDKSEEFRMLLGLTFEADLQNFSNPFKLLSAHGSHTEISMKNLNGINPTEIFFVTWQR